MPVGARQYVLLIGSSCVLFGIVGWVIYAIAFQSAPAQDFMVFYTVARSYIEGNLALIFDGDAFTAIVNDQFTAWLSQPLVLHSWVYPPLFLLLVVPLGFFSFAVAFMLFIGSTFALLTWAIRFYVPGGYQRWLCVAGLLLSPATAWTVMVGQNSFLTTGLLVGGFGLMPRFPLLAGGLLGLLACKPQLWLLVPVALLASKEWKVLGSALATACVLAIASAVIFGVEPWREWLTLMAGPSQEYRHWVQFGRLNGQSIYTEAILLGASAGTANFVQGSATLLCATLVWWCSRSCCVQRDMQLALLLTTAVLAAPHVSNSDTVMVTVAVSLYLCRALREGICVWDAILIIAVWNIEWFNPPQIFRLGLITPLVFTLFVAAVIARGYSNSAEVFAPVTMRRPQAN